MCCRSRFTENTFISNVKRLSCYAEILSLLRIMIQRRASLEMFSSTNYSAPLDQFGRTMKNQCCNRDIRISTLRVADRRSAGDGRRLINWFWFRGRRARRIIGPNQCKRASTQEIYALHTFHEPLDRSVLSAPRISPSPLRRSATLRRVSSIDDLAAGGTASPLPTSSKLEENAYEMITSA